MEQDIVSLIEENGPMSGSEIWEQIGGDGLTLWRTCKLSERLKIQVVGTQYLRLDRRVDGYARLSPSILREFLTYSVIGSIHDLEPIKKKAHALSCHTEEVSKAKLELAYRLVSGFVDRLGTELVSDNEICFIIAGDIVYNMAHDVPRPERSSGKLVNGSDIDLVVVVDDRFPDEYMKRLDSTIYQEKYQILMAPHIREEIDYIVKRLSRVREQVQFDSFRRMVACKILQEGTLLFGSEHLFGQIKAMLRDYGVVDRLNALERRARAFRKEAEKYLLQEPLKKIQEEKIYLFYPAEESEEFE